MTCVETKRYLSSNAYPFQASQESPSIMSLEAKLDDRYANHAKEMKRLEHLEKLRKERESRVIAMPELHENHLVVRDVFFDPQIYSRIFMIGLAAFIIFLSILNCAKYLVK